MFFIAAILGFIEGNNMRYTNLWLCFYFMILAITYYKKYKENKENK